MGRRRPFIKEISETELKAAFGFDPFATAEEIAAAKEEAAERKIHTSREEQPADLPGLLAPPLAEAVEPPRRTNPAIDVDEREAFHSISTLVARNYLSSVGVDAAAALFVELFGKNAVKRALKKPGRPEVLKHSTKHEIVWSAVEARRSARKQTVGEACVYLARHRCIRDSSGDPAFDSADVIEKAFYDADKALKEKRDDMERRVQWLLLSWRRGGESYDTFERGMLRRPGWAVREKPGKVSPSTGKLE